MNGKDLNLYLGKEWIAKITPLEIEPANKMTLKAEYYYRRGNKLFFRDVPGGQKIAVEIDDQGAINSILVNGPKRGDIVKLEFIYD